LRDLRREALSRELVAAPGTGEETTIIDPGLELDHADTAQIGFAEDHVAPSDLTGLSYDQQRVVEGLGEGIGTTLPAVVDEGLDEICARAGAALAGLSGSTVVVAGGAGFLPSFIVDALARANERTGQAPCRIVCIDNLSSGVASRLDHLRGRDDVELVNADISAELEVDFEVDFVVHGASIASPTWYRRYPLETIDANVTGTRRLLDLAVERGSKGFLYLSSSEIYGDPPAHEIPTSEEFWGHVSSTGPRAPYDESKRLAETLCTTYHRLHGLPVTIVRPFNVYGPRLRLDDGRVIPDFIADALAGRPIRVLSDGTATRSFCYIVDFVSAVLLLLVFGGRGEAYNVGNDEEVTIREVAETVSALSGGVGVELGESRDPLYLVDNPNRRCPDLTKTKGTIEWEPVIPLRTGLGRTLDYYREVALA
jgi:UDP-glucuronate decarboxylase